MHWIAQLIKHVHDVPAPAEGQDVEEFVVRDLCGGLLAPEEGPISTLA